jgi:hypothetical protein
MESKALWKQDLAVEMSMTYGGLGVWRGDMTPYTDEQSITGGICAGGDPWHRHGAPFGMPLHHGFCHQP